MSSLKLDYVGLDDIPTVALLDREAFYKNEHPYIEIMHPDSETPEGFDRKVEQWRERLNGLLPNEHFFKVTDTATGKIILTGTWYTPCKSEDNLAKLSQEPKISGPYWRSEDDLAWAQYLSIRYTQRRREAFLHYKGQLFAIKHLTVDPAAQGKGAGAVFMQWGIEEADREGLQCVVESSMRSEGYYRKWGFDRIEHVRFEIPQEEERWLGKGVQEYVWMLRSPRSSTTF
ncbi:hypothetical protein M409DRAFT_48397 [Zasmidium cellare ATCC 36951]|uniref:N-acetyltransferase domain-containing protein n=1 Tax=Zasmidium cellare ATCC 36951 TaxID=1080233 RepID=A0A6A6D2K1_ZASCE|nr:uncharacterized protein M409DRAFT_48397 [Zasmidium cellare ATCC 36951]KAF2173415.1 hypothetical protein M409DRAFT_48397 [Zasmidium cellare ATCC 36951]